MRVVVKSASTGALLVEGSLGHGGPLALAQALARGDVTFSIEDVPVSAPSQPAAAAPPAPARAKDGKR